MSKPPFPSSLSDRSDPDAATDPAEAASAPDATRTSSRAPTATGPRDYKTIMARVNRAGWQEISRLAIDQDRNLEDLIIEACNDLLVREGFSPVMEKRSPPRR
ncbi:MAG: hypothetical protein INR70_15690 [Parafilimonas terrae]|nr:hypothetical protein [Parafilimonas terrae]